MERENGPGGVIDDNPYRGWTAGITGGDGPGIGDGLGNTGDTGGGYSSGGDSDSGGGGSDDNDHYDDAVMRAARQREAEQQRQEAERAEQQRQAAIERERFEREQRRLDNERKAREDAERAEQDRQAAMERERFEREQRRLDNERKAREAEEARQKAQDIENQPQLAFANQHTGLVFGIGWKPVVGSAHHAYAFLENPDSGLRLVTRVGVEASSGVFNGRYTTEEAVPEARSSDKRDRADLTDPARRGEKVLAVGQDAEAAFASVNEVVSRLTSKIGYSVLNDNSNAAIALGLNEANLVPDIDSNTNEANAALSRLTKDGSEPGFNAASAKDIRENSLRPASSNPPQTPTDIDGGSDVPADDASVTRTTNPPSSADHITLPITDNLVVWNGAHSSDNFQGSTANDFILGHGGNDYLYGNEGDDVLHGGAGNDWLSGRSGRDVLTGGTGSDIFFLNIRDRPKDTLGEADLVTDFQIGGDADRIFLGSNVNTVWIRRQDVDANGHQDTILYDNADGERGIHVILLDFDGSLDRDDFYLSAPSVLEIA
ncbi:hypothetical protein AB3X55_01815 [Alphaproteobacteria bacterium LSUCC0719]